MDPSFAVITLFIVICCHPVHNWGDQSRGEPYSTVQNSSEAELQGSFFKDYQRYDRISSNSSQNKSVIWIDGGIHAREWISPATVAFITEQLLKKDGKYFVDTFDWLILPVLNPDGYEYTHTKDRLWRKNRNNRNSRTCPGVDLNRNYGFHWNEGGASDDPCDEIYAGPSAMSEPESKAMSRYILKEKKNRNIVAYLSFHSFGQFWLTPWGWTQEYADDYQDLANLAQDGVDALSKVNGTKYKIHPSSYLPGGVAAGGSDDWAKGVADIKYSYTVELPDTGQYGFQLPKERIPTAAKEAWEGVKAFAKALQTKENL